MDNTKTAIIAIHGLHDVYEFIKEAARVDGDVLIKRGKFAVDAKSFLGVLSLDVSQDVIIVYPTSATEFENYIQPFIVRADL